MTTSFGHLMDSGQDFYKLRDKKLEHMNKIFRPGHKKANQAPRNNTNYTSFNQSHNTNSRRHRSRMQTLNKPGAFSKDTREKLRSGKVPGSSGYNELLEHDLTMIDTPKNVMGGSTSAVNPGFLVEEQKDAKLELPELEGKPPILQKKQYERVSHRSVGGDSSNGDK
uniref:Uncharacterized protein n=1 Tax=Euplotes crassus TaxID=5936 RepID=A0A7S3NYU8_EUPCR|mmetsp:Transcript_34195/g.33784  ORF Transcript_34195/g.33784 Transcript_34195/m.33784 type:complete len:167 (+) Transcript_34195:581-1081(+)